MNETQPSRRYNANDAAREARQQQLASGFLF
jgi:hypothetical protein